MNIGDDQFVKDGDTKAIDFPICINQEGISDRFMPGARYATSIFLRDIRGGGAPLLGIFEGSTPADNWTNVSFPAARLRAITVTLDQLVVNDDMDNASPGDWHVTFDVANFSGAEAPRYGRRIGGPPFPNPTGTQNVSTHTTVPIGRSVSFPSISQSETLVVEVRVADCDQDAPLGGKSRFGGSLDCNDQEEFWELSGNHDLFAGPVVTRRQFRIAPRREFTANISVVVAP